MGKNTKEYNKRYYEANKHKRKKQTYQDRADYFREYMREYQRKNKDTLVPYNRARRYGLDVESMEELLEQAGDKCPICELDFDVETTGKCIDHYHETGEIRGVICNKCNMAAGMLRDDVEAMKRLIKHIES